MRLPILFVYEVSMHPVLILTAIVLFALSSNIPLGYLREKCKKFTFGWYFYIHVSIPFIIFLRIESGFSWKFIPLTLAGAAAGQLVGGRLHGRGRNGE